MSDLCPKWLLGKVVVTGAAHGQAPPRARPSSAATSRKTVPHRWAWTAGLGRSAGGSALDGRSANVTRQ
ncbi:MULTISPECIES: hypothetical protein [unclassified Streptomyces]|uniref:hypothetical protein n=1 Tax=unclassified Streptomyces TaxID=2593676 RepID=UPI001CBDF0CC|nr:MULTISPECIES: hypothetical protein [unclassified Streptomyces]WPO70388.1 hypothetical protein R9806_07010 [Streptomyces sp. KN37]